MIQHICFRYGLFGCFIFAKYPEIVEQGRYRRHGLTVALIVVKGEVDMEEVFPFAPYYGRRLYAGEVEVVEAEYGQYSCQGSFAVRE